MDGNPGPNEIVQNVAGWGSHTVSTTDWGILPRNSSRNELIYKVMYYGFKGPAQWSGFGNYKRPFPSRDGSTYYSTGLSNAQLVAYYLTHAALSRAYAQGISYASENQQGFSAFWSYVNNASPAPENFYVFVWDNSSDPYKNGRRVQDMMISIANVFIQTDKDIVVESGPMFATLDPMLVKHNSKNEFMAGVDFSVDYYNDDSGKVCRHWILTTDELGQIRWDENHLKEGDTIFADSTGNYVLLPGQYYFSEVNTPDGYVKTEDFIIDVDDQAQVTCWNKDHTNQIILSSERGYDILEYREGLLQIRKKVSDEEIEKKCPAAGTVFQLYDDRECLKPSRDINGNECRLTINEDGNSETVTLIPGMYYIKEIETTFLWHLDEEVHSIEVKESEDIEDVTVWETINYPQDFRMKTKASYHEAENEYIGTSKADYVITDIVEYENLKTGHTYVLKTRIMDRKSGEPITDADGGSVESSSELIPETPNGTCRIEFTLPAHLLLDREIVVYEELFMNDYCLISHCDPEDLQQTVIFPETRCLIEIHKEDEMGNMLAGCGFTLFNSNGSIADDVNGQPATGTTDENGILQFEVRYKTDGYYLQETSVPQGYELNDRRIQVLFSENLNLAQSEPVILKVINYHRKLVDTADSSYLGVWMALLACTSSAAIIMRILADRKTK